MAATRQMKVGGVILAGARRWGESALERIGPRPLLPVAGRPLIWYGLNWLKQSGIDCITVCANGDTPAIRSFLGDGNGMGMHLDYYEDVMPRGPAGCVRDAAIKRNDDAFVIVEGALLPRADLDLLLQAHIDSRSALTIVAAEQEPFRCGTAQLRPAGIYVVSRSALNLVPEHGYQDIKEMWIPRLHQHGCRIAPYIVEAEAVVGVTGLGSYLRAAMSTLEGAAGHDGWGGDYRRVGGAWVHQSARVMPSARLSDLVLVGPRAVIDSKVAVVGRTIIGPDSRIGGGAILSEMVSWPGCDVGPGAILNRCILLAGSSIEPGLVVRDTVWCNAAAGRPEPAGRAAMDYWAMELSPAVPGTRMVPGIAGPAHRPAGAANQPAPAPTTFPDVRWSPSPF